MLTKINGFPISAGFGTIDSVHKIPHKGVDIAMPEGTPLHAIADGIVSRINDEGMRSFGKSIRIEYGDGTEVIYGHLSEIKARVGEHVNAGDIVALSGDTGRSTGPHLHLQMIAENGELIDPTTVAHNGTVWSWIADKFPDSWRGPLFSVIDGNPETTVSNTFFASLGRWASDKLDALITLLNANSSDIITFGIVVCAFGVMIAPMTGKTSAAWFGKLFVVSWIGVTWRVLI